MGCLKSVCAASFDFSAMQFLLLVAIQNDGAIRRAFVRALTVQRRRVVRLPENFQQLVVGNLRGIKFNLRHLGMAGRLGADFLIGRIFRGAAGESARDGNDAGQPFKNGLHAPEAAAAEVGDFSFVCVHRYWFGCAQRGKIQRACGKQNKMVCFIFHNLTGRLCLIGQSIRFRFVQMFARRQVGEFLKMFRAQRLGNGVFAVEPFAEVNQLAALRAERPEFPGQPVAGLFARRAFDLRQVLFGFRCDRFDVIDHIRRVVRRSAAVLQNFLHVVKNHLLLRRRKMRAVENGVDILRQFWLLRVQFFLSGNGRCQIIGKLGNGSRRRLCALAPPDRPDRFWAATDLVAVGFQSVEIDAQVGNVLQRGLQAPDSGRRIVLRRRSWRVGRRNCLLISAFLAAAFLACCLAML